MNKLLAVLREAGVAAPPKPAEVNARERIFNDFAGYLARDRGLVPRTIIRHWPPVRLFLQEAGVEAIGDFARLDQAAIIGFVERHARDHSPAAAKGLCWALRAFLRYLRRQGWTSIDLAGSVPFRHSLATALLRSGASLTEIGQVLRHRDPDTTRLYAKVDIDTLRRLGAAWPGGRP